MARACRWAASFQFLALVLLTDLTYYYFFRLYRSGMLDNQRQGRFRTQVAALEPVPPRPLVRQRIYRGQQGTRAVAVQPGRCGRGGVQRWAELMPGGRQPRVSQTNIRPPHLRCARLRLSHSKYSYRVWTGGCGWSGSGGEQMVRPGGPGLSQSC